MGTRANLVVRRRGFTLIELLVV
ncbi:MAG: prepilin-type N-terminal cleavage/methylation domain-containing protein, partial [Anaerohalosphaera sp.]|nr:prepilin-type N-terminal cleavage/methylation domain-containing protein [Anaerohalosphaera sp.]